MPIYEYKVIPAPTRGRKAPGFKTPEARFALGLEDMLNIMGQDGWDYQRSDILPSEERQGFTSSHTVYRSVLVFRRETVVSVDPANEAGTTPSEVEPRGLK
ncbi:hypothetical protein SAMN05443999_103197 [Roseovarius azorensis]|uniref:DUF4177 domain-containing protein n=1 Tax=Roseovarius azorensis TaxID=1287727 RepID=A0A1H7M3X8_9RHOB|nr:hypothetical protein SAMN05443999_103197 [Roseovarius azorensis]